MTENKTNYKEMQSVYAVGVCKQSDISQLTNKDFYDSLLYFNINDELAPLQSNTNLENPSWLLLEENTGRFKELIKEDEILVLREYKQIYFETE